MLNNTQPLSRMYRKQLYFLIVLLVSGAIVVYAEGDLEPRAIAEMRTETINVLGEDIVVRVAHTAADQKRGLKGVTSLTDAQGMLFSFGVATEVSFWNQDMDIPFDLIWIKNERVVGMEHAVPAYAAGERIVTSPGVVTHVLELASGWAERHGLRMGDIISGL